jgi:hypothetical protein
MKGRFNYNEMGRIGKEAFVVYFKIVCCSLEEMKKTMKNLSQDMRSLVKQCDLDALLLCHSVLFLEVRNLCKYIT